MELEEIGKDINYPMYPDWSYWLYIPTTSVDHLVALSMDINPKALSAIFEYEAPITKGLHDALILRRNIVLANLAPDGLLMGDTDASYEGLTMLRVSEFVQWLDDMELDYPDELKHRYTTPAPEPVRQPKTKPELMVEVIKTMGLDPLNLVVGDGEKKEIFDECCKQYPGKFKSEYSDTFKTNTWRTARSKKLIVVVKK